MKIDIQIKESALVEKECHDFVADGGAGGIVVFVGTVRNQNKGNSSRPVLLCG